MEKNRTILEIVVEGSEISIPVLAHRVGVSERSMRYYIEGKIYPRVDVAKKIAEQLHMPIDALW